MKIIALDLDGTLLNSHKHLSNRTLRAIEKAATTGHQIVPATGRALKAIPTEILSLSFIRYIISINGASVTDQISGKRLYSADIPKATALRLLTFARRFDCMYDCYWQDAGWVNQAFLDRITYYNQDEEVIKLIRKSRRPVQDLDAFISAYADSIQKVQLCFRNPDERSDAVNQLRLEFPEIVATSSFRNNLELNWHTADKGRGLLVLAKHLGVLQDDTIAFGDSSNDMTMLRTAGVGVAMGNASENVKNECDAVTETNDHDGVAVYLEQRHSMSLKNHLFSGSIIHIPFGGRSIKS